MANISTNTDCNISFTDEEKEVLKKASEICKNIAREIWQDGNGTDEEDIAEYFFSGISESLENALKGDW